MDKQFTKEEPRTGDKVLLRGSTMKYKVGDKVRIRSREWIDAQKKDSHGDILCKYVFFFRKMFKYAGKVACVKEVLSSSYELDIDGGRWYWTDKMLDPRRPR